MTTIGQRLIESLSRENDRGDYDAVLKLSRALVTLDSGSWVQVPAPDAPKGPEPTPEQSHMHYTCPNSGCGWGVGCVGDSDDPEEDQRIADQIEQEIADHERKHREDAARPSDTWRTADLCAADLGRIIETNGYRGRLRRIEVTEEGGYVRLLLSEQHDSDARFPVLVKLDMPVRVMPEVTA